MTIKVNEWDAIRLDRLESEVRAARAAYNLFKSQASLARLTKARAAYAAHVAANQKASLL